MAGFFNYFGGAQWIYLILVIGFHLFLISALFVVPIGGKKVSGTVSNNFLYTIAIFILFYWGGFFDSLIQFIK